MDSLNRKKASQKVTIVGAIVDFLLASLMKIKKLLNHIKAQ
jgi:hypothetical protein